MPCCEPAPAGVDGESEEICPGVCLRQHESWGGAERASDEWRVDLGASAWLSCTPDSWRQSIFFQQNNTCRIVFRALVCLIGKRNEDEHKGTTIRQTGQGT